MTEQRDMFPDLQALMNAPLRDGPTAPKRKTPVPRGHAAPPGSGPAGETCGTCANRRSNVMRSGRRFPKCRLVKWTGGRGTDIRLRDPACSRFEPIADAEAAPAATSQGSPDATSTEARPRADDL